MVAGKKPRWEEIVNLAARSFRYAVGILLVAMTLVPVHGAECNITVKSCITAAGGGVVFALYNGNDTEHAIAATWKDNVGYGESVPLSCHTDVCDLKISLSPVSGPSFYRWLHDDCRDMTFYYDGERPTELGQYYGIKACDD